MVIGLCHLGFPGGPGSKESTCRAGDDLGSTSGLETSSGEGNVYRLQYSYLENPMDRRSYSPAGGLQSVGSQRVRHN